MSQSILSGKMNLLPKNIGCGKQAECTGEFRRKTETPSEFVQTAFCFLTLNPAETCQSSPRRRESRFAARRAGRWQRWRVAPWAWRGRRQVRYRAGRFWSFSPASSSVGVWMWAKSARLMPKRFYKPDHIGAMPVPLPRKKPNRMFISPSGSRKRLLRKPPASTALKPMSAVSAAARFFASSSSAARNT